jgi:putative mRNA 3-end processing factor
MKNAMDLLELRAEGIYCAAGDFYIDPWEAVERAVVTNAGQARPGSRAYLTARSGAGLVRERLGADVPLEGAEYGERVAMGDAAISLHPAGHLLGSAQVRIERGGEVWVYAGDFRPAADATCERFEPLRCHTLLTGAAFGLPIFRWPAESETMAAIHEWWRGNREAGKTSVLYAAPLGQAQRVLARLDGSMGTLWLHEEVERVCAIYRAGGIDLPVGGEERSATLKIAPPGGGERERGARVSTGMVSGWMRIRGTRRRRSLDRGFVLSGQADWTELLGAIDATGAETVCVTHGFRAPLARWLEEHGRRARTMDARFEEAEG